MNSPSEDSKNEVGKQHRCVENIEYALFLLSLPFFEVSVKTYEDAIQDAKEQSWRHRMCRESESNRTFVCSGLCYEHLVWIYV